MANKYHSDSRVPLIEYISMHFGEINTGDLEAATKTISATAEATGLGNADYSKALTIYKPTDPRVSILSLCARLSLTIDSDDGTHDLRCRVYADAQDADHLILDITCSTTGAQVSSQSLTASVKPILFNLLADGAAHTYYFYFWSPGSHSPVISYVYLISNIGTNDTYFWGKVMLKFTPTTHCEVQSRVYLQAVGSGTFAYMWFLGGYISHTGGMAGMNDSGIYRPTSTPASLYPSLTLQLLPKDCAVALAAYTNVATDMAYIYGASFFIKRWE